MFNKCLLVSWTLIYMKSVCFCDHSAENTETILSSPNENMNVEDLYGYKNDEVTQGVGYGHYLHPHYYQGEQNKFYNCAVEEDWKPLNDVTEPTLTQLPVKLEKIQPVKKYKANGDKKLKHRKGKILLINRNGMYYDRRNDLVLDGDFVLNPHTRFIKDINSLSETSEFLHPFSFDHHASASHHPVPSSLPAPQVSQLVLPSDAEILIVKKKPGLISGSSNIESVLKAPPSFKSPNGIVKMGVTNFVYKDGILKNSHHLKLQNKKPVIVPPIDGVQASSQPYKFITPVIEDVLRTKYKKPLAVLPFNMGSPSAHVIVKTKRYVQPNLKDLPFWERFVLTFFKLTK